MLTSMPLSIYAMIRRVLSSDRSVSWVSMLVYQLPMVFVVLPCGIYTKFVQQIIQYFSLAFFTVVLMERWNWSCVEEAIIIQISRLCADLQSIVYFCTASTTSMSPLSEGILVRIRHVNSTRGEAWHKPATTTRLRMRSWAYYCQIPYKFPTDSWPWLGVLTSSNAPGEGLLTLLQCTLSNPNYFPSNPGVGEWGMPLIGV